LKAKQWEVSKTKGLIRITKIISGYECPKEIIISGYECPKEIIIFGYKCPQEIVLSFDELYIVET
jgi:hypothetical protein